MRPYFSFLFRQQKTEKIKLTNGNQGIINIANFRYTCAKKALLLFSIN